MASNVLKPSIDGLTHEEWDLAFGVHYLPSLRFDSPELSMKAQAYVPWLLAHTVFGAEHRKLGALLHKQIATGYVARVKIQWIDPVIGYGLFANEAIPIHSFVGIYAGVVRQIRRFSARLNGYCMHYPTRFWSYHYWVIDAEHEGNEMRFVNHSQEPNLKAMSVLDRGIQYIALFSVKAILPGEQLTLNYGKDYWKNRPLHYSPSKGS